MSRSSMLSMTLTMKLGMTRKSYDTVAFLFLLICPREVISSPEDGWCSSRDYLGGSSDESDDSEPKDSEFLRFSINGCIHADKLQVMTTLAS